MTFLYIAHIKIILNKGLESRYLCKILNLSTLSKSKSHVCLQLFMVAGKNVIFFYTIDTSQFFQRFL